MAEEHYVGLPLDVLQDKLQRTIDIVKYIEKEEIEGMQPGDNKWEREDVYKSYRKYLNREIMYIKNEIARIKRGNY